MWTSQRTDWVIHKKICAKLRYGGALPNGSKIVNIVRMPLGGPQENELNPAVVTTTRLTNLPKTQKKGSIQAVPVITVEDWCSYWNVSNLDHHFDNVVPCGIKFLVWIVYCGCYCWDGIFSYSLLHSVEVSPTLGFFLSDCCKNGHILSRFLPALIREFHMWLKEVDHWTLYNNNW